MSFLISQKHAGARLMDPAMAPAKDVASVPEAKHRPRKFSRTTIDILAQACDFGCDKRKHTLRILLGMLYSHSFQLVALPITMQESIIRRIVAQLVGRPDLPMLGVMLLYTIWGEWRVTAQAMRRERKLFSSMDKKMGKEVLEQVCKAWIEYFQKEKAKIRNAQKTYMLMAGASGKQLLQIVNDGWKHVLEQEKNKAGQRKKLLSMMSGGSESTLKRTVVSGWRECIQQDKMEAEQERMKQLRISAVMRTMTKGNDGILVLSTFQLWRQVFLDSAAETLQAAEEAEKKEAAMRQAQRLVFAASGALLQDSFREWRKIIEQTKQKLEAQKQMLAVMGSGQSVMMLGTTFGAWAKDSQDEKKRMKRMKELQKKFLNEDQTRIESAFVNWSKAYLEAKKAFERNKKILMKFTCGQSAAVLSCTFSAWREDYQAILNERAADKDKALREERRMKQIHIMMSSRDGPAALTVPFHAWNKFAVESKANKENESKKSKYLGATLQRMLNGNNMMMMTSSFRDWTSVVMEAKQEKRDEQAARRREAEKDQKRKALMTVFNANDEMLRANVWGAWKKKVGDAAAQAQSAAKMMKWMAGGDSSACLGIVLRSWAEFSKNEKHRRESKGAATKVAGMMAQGDAKLEMAKTLAAWQKVVETRKQKVEANKKVFAHMVSNNSGASCRLFLAEWLKYIDIVRRERRDGAQREQNRSAAERMVFTMLNASVSGALMGWKEYMKDIKAQREKSQKQDTMCTLMGKGDGPLVMTRFMMAWVELMNKSKQDKQMDNWLRSKESADEQKSWVTGRVLQTQETTLQVDTLLRWRHVVAMSRADRFKERLAFRNQQLPVIMQDLIGRLTEKANLLHKFQCFCAWQRLPAVSAQRRQVQKKTEAMSFLSGPLRKTMTAWSTWTREKLNKDMQRIRYDRAARTGLVRWIAANVLLSISMAFRIWWQEASAERRSKERRQLQRLSVEATDRDQEASMLRAEAEKSRAALERARRATETAVGSAMVKSLAQQSIGGCFTAWRRAVLDKHGDAMKKNETQKRRSLISQKAVGAFTSKSDDGIKRKAWAAWGIALKESSTQNPTSLYVLGGFGSHHSPHDADRLNVATGNWEALPRLPSPRCAAAAACVTGWIYVVGGFCGSEHLETADRLNLATARWEHLQHMSDKRGYVAAASDSDCIFAIGGFNGSSRLSSVEMYDPPCRSWSRAPPMALRRQCAAAAFVEGYLYVCGGDDGKGPTDSVERYSPRGQRWEAVPSMQVRRSGAAAVAVLGKLFVIGGSDGHPTATCERYDPEDCVWSSLPPLKIRRDGVGAATLGGTVYVFGGHDGTLRQRSLEALAPGAAGWRDMHYRSSIGRNFAAIVAGPGR